MAQVLTRWQREQCRCRAVHGLQQFMKSTATYREAAARGRGWTDDLLLFVEEELKLPTREDLTDINHARRAIRRHLARIVRKESPHPTSAALVLRK